MQGLVDLHAHVLPGVDDGPADLDEALALCRAMAGTGVARVAATSHVSETHPNRAATMAPVRARLQEALAAAGIALEVLPGGEVTIEQALALDDDVLAQLGLGGPGGFVLLEAPLSQAVADVEAGIGRVLDRGHKVLIAHPERAPVFQRHHDQLVRLVAAGALTAVTAGAVGGRFGRTAARAAHRMLAEDLVHVLTSDAHDLAGRPPGLVEGVGEAADRLPGLRDALPFLLRDAPEAILRGEPPGLPPVRIDLPAESSRAAGGPLRRLFGRR